MTKRLLSTALAMLVIVGMLPFASVSANAADSYYNVSKSIKYAAKNWNNGKGLCADFASKCLQAGGVDVQEDTVKALYTALNGKYGKAYKLKLTGGTKGTIKMADNKGKLSQGDPVFYKCNKCGDFEHVVICNGANSAGYAQDYAHNNAHNGKKQTYTYSHCGGESWTLYSIKMVTGPTLYGAKSSVGVPKITTLGNGADGVVVKWSKVKGADYYRVYRKTADSSWQRVISTKANSFTDKTAKNDVEYTYTVRAVDGKKASQYYGGESVKAITAPKLVAVNNKTNSIKFDWSKISSADGYLVYRKTGNSGWQRVAKIKGANKNYFTDKNIEDGVKYTYTVRAYDGSLTGAYVSAGKKIVFLKAPEELTTECIADGVSLKFPSIEGATGYRIFRKTADDSKWTIIANVKGSDISEYIDTNVENGVSYTYTVRAFNGSSFSLYNKKGVTCEYVQELFGEIPDTEFSETTTPESIE